MLAAAMGVNGSPSPFQRRNTIPSSSSSSSSVIFGKHNLPLEAQSSSFRISNDELTPLSNGQLELVSLRSMTYTSLRDLLPSPSAGIPSPPFTGNQSWHEIHEIPIKNRLVKQAAWAYLQPMSTSSELQGQGFFHRLVIRCPGECVRNQVDGCFGFINEHVVPTIRRAFRAISDKWSNER